jgi:general stress protein YciG
MPRGNYSNTSDNEGLRRGMAITEPDDAWSSSRHQTAGALTEIDQESDGIQAKEPDRQGTARRGAQSGRGRMSEDSQEEQAPREQGSSRSSSRGRGAQSAQARRGGSERGQTRRGTETESRTGRQKKSRRGFAAMSPEQQREIARKGGLTVSRNRRHMADIGRVGGEHSHGGRRGRARR